MENRINPVLYDIRQEFAHESGSEWAVEYRVVIADKLHSRFSLRRLRRMPSVLGYNFWLVVRSKGFAAESEDIDREDIDKALVAKSNDLQAARDYVSEKIAAIGEVTWDEFEAKAAAFLNVSDIQDDARQDTKGA